MKQKIPERIARLPADADGCPIFWLIGQRDGVPDFSHPDPDKLVRAIGEQRCGICGEPLGQYRAFVISPHSLLLAQARQPPMHRECATYIALASPWLAVKLGIQPVATPEVNIVWITREYAIFPASESGGVIFDLTPKPTEALWFIDDKRATRGQARAALMIAVDRLREIAQEMREEDFDMVVRAAECFLPPQSH